MKCYGKSVKLLYHVMFGFAPIVILGVLVGGVVCWGNDNDNDAEDRLIALRFDCGTPQSPVKESWTQVTHETVYTPQRGYGWLRPASSSFDRHELFVPDWLKATVGKKFPVDDTLRDGVFDKDVLTFRVDVPDGDYYLIVSIGDEGATRRNMSVIANGTVIAERVTTQTLWGGDATTRTFRRRLTVKGGKLEVSFRHDGEGNSVLAIEVITFVPYPIQFSDGRWQTGEPDADLQRGLEALNQRRWQDAKKPLDRIAHPLLRATALMAWADFLDVPEEVAHKAIEQAIALAHGVLQAQPLPLRESILANELIRIGTNYLQARRFMMLLSYEHAAKETGLTFARRLRMANDWCEQISEFDPLFDRACLNLGRIHYWIWRQGANPQEKALADKWFGIVKGRQPFARLVRLYTGEQVSWGQEYVAAVEGMPEWLAKQRDAMGRLLEVLRWWVDNRQLENGEMGGHWNDDVEMLRQWHVFIAGADDETVKRGWLRLAHGIWYSGEIERGYCKHTWDVQHSAENTSDSQPALVGLDYGNPVWVERCMETIQLMRDFWTGINARGHRHFKSASFGATDMNTKPPWGVDVPCNGRATRPGLWVGWYNRNPAIVQLFREWMDAWVEDAMREEEGKPAGVLPAAISYETDRIGGYGKNWYEPNIYWDYFNWPGYTDEIYDHMLAVYEWTGDEKYLKPIEAAMELAMEWKRNPVQDVPKGSRMWAARVLYRTMAATVEKYRVLTGRKRFDDYLRENGSPWMRFLLTGDKRALISGCESAAARMRSDFELLTSEVLFTDRVAVTQYPMWAMMTGGVGRPYFYPCYFVTWQDTGTHFAALVAHADETRLKVLLCHFEPKPKTVRMRLWRLQPGVYEWRLGLDANGDDIIDTVGEQRRFSVMERGETVPVRLLPRLAYILEVSKRSDLPSPVPAFHDRPDLAIGDQDIFIGKTPEQVQQTQGWLPPWKPVVLRYAREVPVTVIVHNIGRQATPNALVKIWEQRKQKWQVVSQAKVPILNPPNNLSPSRFPVALRWRPKGTGEKILKVTVEPVAPCLEITRTNNSVYRSVELTSKPVDRRAAQ